MKWGPEPVTNVLEKYHSMEHPILFSAQSSDLESGYSSHISSNFMNLAISWNKKVLSEDKIDVTNFISLTAHFKSIYSYFTQSNAFLYPILVSKGWKHIIRGKIRAEAKKCLTIRKT